MASDEDTVMEELETLMIRLEGVFQAFHGKPMITSKSSLRLRPNKSRAINNLVAEAADQIHNFAYNFRLDHEL